MPPHGTHLGSISVLFGISLGRTLEANKKQAGEQRSDCRKMDAKRREKH
jgi:hypothetical protein